MKSCVITTRGAASDTRTILPDSPSAVSPSSHPLLIVNADDLGWNRGATDLTIASFGAGQVTSATALVHMEDSERAATLAREHDLPTGLHLNLSDPFTGTE